MRAPKNPSPQYTDLAAFVAAQTTPAKAAGNKPRTIKDWAITNRGKLTIAATAASMGPAGDLLSAAGDGWKTALTLGAAGAAATGAWGWLPGLVKWRGAWLPARTLPTPRDRYTALSMPLTGSTLLTTMAAVGGPEWGENPWWGFSLVWSAAYGTWAWKRWGRRPAAKAPQLTRQMLDWMEYAAPADGPYPKSKLVSPLALPKGGWSAEVLLPRGKKFEMRLTETASALDIDDLDLIAMEKLGPRRGRISVFTTNPLKTGTLFGTQHVLDPETGLAPIGIYYDGEQAHYRFFLPGSGAVHSFVTGTSGSGKSRLLDALLGIERRSPLVCSIVVDPQAGLSLPDWPDGVAVFAPGNDFGIVVLRAVHAIMKERANRYNRMKWTDDKGRERVGRAHFVPGDPDPLLSLTLDEAHDLLTDPDHGEEAVKIIGDIAKEARKVGIKFRLANQSPNASELGGETLIRDILQGGNNAVLRSGSSATGKRAAGNALGDIDPGAIPKEFNDGTGTGGLGYLAGPDNRAAMWRAPYVEDPFGLAHEGHTTGIEQTTIDALPLVRHILDEHALMLRLRNAGEQYTYDPERFDDTQPATAPARRKTKAPSPSLEKVPAAAEPQGPTLSQTARKIVAFLLQHGKPAAPAIIAKTLDLTGPQVRTALGRMKDDPAAPIVNLGHGAWIHTDHASNYTTAA
ncbi:type IV secretory system conjugative DNA transfer family protein [Streptomyces celluloflavus]|uniref:type IV secretory system conjugative DNA transfer family protein n=1 Tax=Streptomyces celluloflavus TaxID=58344 RepID=UPI0037970F83